MRHLYRFRRKTSLYEGHERSGYRTRYNYTSGAFHTINAISANRIEIYVQDTKGNVAITLSQTESGGIEKILSIQFEGHQCLQERRGSNILMGHYKELAITAIHLTPFKAAHAICGRCECS